MALAYNLEGEPEKDLYTLRFTSDPTGELAPQVTLFNWYCPSDNPLYDPYSTLLWELRCKNAAKVKYRPRLVPANRIDNGQMRLASTPLDITHAKSANGKHDIANHHRHQCRRNPQHLPPSSINHHLSATN